MLAVEPWLVTLDLTMPMEEVVEQEGQALVVVMMEEEEEEEEEVERDQVLVVLTLLSKEELVMVQLTVSSPVKTLEINQLIRFP